MKNIIRALLISILLCIPIIAITCSELENNTSETMDSDLFLGENLAAAAAYETATEITTTPDAESTTEAVTEPESTTETETEPATETEQPVEINIAMIGDMLIHEGVYNSGVPNSDGTYSYDHLFTNIKSELTDCDIKIVNQETILGGRELGLSAYPSFNSPYEIADAIVNAGFNVVLHATNHTMDRGLTAINNCLSYWRTNYPDTTVLGLNDTEDEYNDIYVYEKDGFKIAILNYTYGLNGIALPSEKPYVVNMIDSEHADKVVSDIQKAKELADMVIVCPHWGTEYVYEPDSFQTEWTEKFLELGVDVVVGTHPHVIEPVEVLTREDGHQMLVYYSLGNFVSNQSFIPRMIGAMAKFTLVKEADNTTYIKQYSVVPLVTQKLFGQGLITTYKLSDYTDELANQNDIKANSDECFSAAAYYKCQCGATALGLTTHGGANFSLSYCQQLCSKVFGAIYDNGGTVILRK